MSNESHRTGPRKRRPEFPLTEQVPGDPPRRGGTVSTTGGARRRTSRLASRHCAMAWVLQCLVHEELRSRAAKATPVAAA